MFRFVGAALIRDVIRCSMIPSVRQCSSSPTLELIHNQVLQKERLSPATIESYVRSTPTIAGPELAYLFKCISQYLPDVARTDKVNLIETVWQTYSSQSIPNETDFLALLQVRRENGATDNLEAILRQMKLLKLQPSATIFEEILYFVSSTGDSSQTVAVLDLIKTQRFPLTERIFNAIIVAHARDKNIENVELVKELMTNTGSLSLNQDTKYELTRAYIQNEQWDSALELLDTESFSVHQLLNILRASVQINAQCRILTTIVNKFPVDMLCHKEVATVLRNFLTEVIHVEGKPGCAVELMKLLPKVAESENYGAFLINELFSVDGQHKHIFDLCEFLYEQGRNRRAMFVATEIALRQQSSQSMLYLERLSKIENLKPHYFWPILLNEFQLDGEQGIVNTLKCMKKFKTELDLDTMNIYVLPKLGIVTKDIKQGLRTLTDCGVKPIEMLDSIASQLLLQHRFHDLIYVCETYPGKLRGDLLAPTLARSVASAPKIPFNQLVRLLNMKLADIDLGGNILIELLNCGKYSQAVTALKEYAAANIRISPLAKEKVEVIVNKKVPPALKVTILGMLKRLGVDHKVQLSHQSSLEPVHPREMNFTELECHLAELTGKNMNTRGVLRKLLQLAVRNNKLERALELKAECDRMDVVLSPGMLASCLMLYAKTGKVAEAKSAWNTLRHKYPGFVVDEHKVIDYATMLIASENNIVEAQRALEDRAKCKLFMNSNKNIWQLLTSLIEHPDNKSNPDASVSQPMLDFLVKLKYCDYNNTLFGPVVREWLLKGNVPKAVSSFLEIAAKHRKTPLKLELMTTLIRMKNAGDSDAIKHIELMTKAIEETHGHSAAIMNLLFATAEGGTDNQVRKILIDPSMQLDREAFQNQCEYLSNAGKVEALLRLAKSSRGLGYVTVNEHKLMTIMMQTLAKGNKIDEAVQLFERLVDEDEFKMSREIAEPLMDLLKRNNLNVPSRLETYCS